MERAIWQCMPCHPCRGLSNKDTEHRVDADRFPASVWQHMSDEFRASAPESFRTELQPRSLRLTRDYFEELVDHPEVEIEPGVFYKGQWKGTQCHGKGVLRRADGCLYDGEFQEGRPHGTGKFEAENGGTYEGQWDQDKAHGYGTYRFPDGSVYEGEWYQDEKNGRGRERWADGSQYEGQFLNGSRQGHGRYCDDKGRLVFEGQFRQDGMDGEGQYHFANGRIYEGQWRSGHIHGRGTMMWPNKSVYRGSFVCDTRQGEGTLEWPDGRKYHGQWSHGKQDGKGILVDCDGTSVEGLWKEGVQVEIYPARESDDDGADFEGIASRTPSNDGIEGPPQSRRAASGLATDDARGLPGSPRNAFGPCAICPATSRQGAGLARPSPSSAQLSNEEEQDNESEEANL